MNQREANREMHRIFYNFMCVRWPEIETSLDQYSDEDQARLYRGFEAALDTLFEKSEKRLHPLQR